MTTALAMMGLELEPIAAPENNQAAHEAVLFAYLWSEGQASNLTLI